MSNKTTSFPGVRKDIEPITVVLENEIERDRTPVKIFFCYAHEDSDLVTKLKAHLMSLQHEGLVDFWYDRDILAGSEWQQEIDSRIKEADIILLLVSAEFLASKYCYGVEMKQALERHKRKEALAIPIILRPVNWQGLLGHLQALPTDAKPIQSSHWNYIDEAFLDVVNGISKILKGKTYQEQIEPKMFTPEWYNQKIEEAFDHLPD